LPKKACGQNGKNYKQNIPNWNQIGFKLKTCFSDSR
jgi:hypothetical protein